MTTTWGATCSVYLPLLLAVAARYILGSQMWRRMWGLGLVAAVAATTGVLACRQLVGITDNPPEDLVTSICGLPYGTNVCASCVNTSCCAESTACAASAACTTYQTCIGKCSGDPGCRSQCMISDPGIAPEVSALDACLASSCETQCGLTCGSLVERLTPPDASAPCETCFQSACDTARACASSVDCDEYTRCFVACPTPDCREACATAHDAGAALFAPVQKVYEGACSTDCAYGLNWNCVGHVVYPATTITSVTQTGALLDYNTSLPVSGADVCLSYDPLTCGSPGQLSATTRTDTNGKYTVTLQLPAVAAFGAAQPSFQGWTRYSSPNIVTAWGLMGFPQTEPTWNITPEYADTTNTPDEVAMDEAAVGLTPDPSRAIISMRVYDCLGTPAPNVKVSLDPAAQDSQTSVWYSGTSIATPSDAANDAGTNNTGLAIFINVPAPDAGAVNVPLTATPVGLGKVSSHQGVSILAGVTTSVGMTPTP